MWLLSEKLLTRGHSVLWWHSTFSHQTRTLFREADTLLKIEERFELKLLHTNRYRRNISWARYKHHLLVARRFRDEADRLPVPDVIVCALPTVELAYEAVLFGKRRNVPVIIDIRDLWPEAIVEKSPAACRGLINFAFTSMFRRRREALANATSVVAVSRNYLSRCVKQAGRLPSDNDKVFYLGAEGTRKNVGDGTEYIEKLRESLSGKTVFTFIGSFGRSYELKILVDVCRRLARENVPNVHFVLAGDGEQYKSLQNSAVTLNNVTLTGWLDQNNLDALLNFSDVGIVPCRSVPDTVPNKVFDYTSASLPLLSSLQGEMEEIIETNDIGFSYQSGDVETLYQHVRRLAGDPLLRQRQAANARELFAREYNADVTYTAYARHIEEIARYGMPFGRRTQEFSPVSHK